MLSAREAMALQGFPGQYAQVVSDRQLAMLAGNSMSVDVLVPLLRAVLEYKGWLAQGSAISRCYLDPADAAYHSCAQPA